MNKITKILIISLVMGLWVFIVLYIDKKENKKLNFFYPTEAFQDVNYTHQLVNLPTEGTFKVEVDTTTRNIMTIIYKSREAGIDEVSALKISICESRLDDQAKNPNSSAKGLFQIIDKTFKTYCKGDPLNAEDSTDCFLKLYKSHPSWWICRG